MPVLPEELARNLFGTGMDDGTWAAHYAQLTPDAPGLMNAVVSGYPSGCRSPTCRCRSTSRSRPNSPRRWRRTSPAAEHRIIPDAGHTIMTTHPELLASIINESAG